MELLYNHNKPYIEFTGNECQSEEIDSIYVSKAIILCPISKQMKNQAYLISQLEIPKTEEECLNFNLQKIDKAINKLNRTRWLTKDQKYVQESDSDDDKELEINACEANYYVDEISEKLHRKYNTHANTIDVDYDKLHKPKKDKVNTEDDDTVFVAFGSKVYKTKKSINTEDCETDSCEESDE